mgnify:CR=1 FL=1
MPAAMIGQTGANVSARDRAAFPVEPQRQHRSRDRETQHITDNADQAHLQRTFKQLLAATPGQYRHAR